MTELRRFLGIIAGIIEICEEITRNFEETLQGF